MTKYTISYQLERINKRPFTSTMIIHAASVLDLYKRFYRLHPNGLIIKLQSDAPKSPISMSQIVQ